MIPFIPHQPDAPCKERLALLALHFVPGIGSFLIKQLIGHFGSASEVFHANKRELLKVSNIGTRLAHALKTADTLQQAETEFAKAKKKEVRILFFNDKDFPHRLQQFDDSPSMLYAKGNINLNAEKIVSIIGTRQATSYGKEIVNKLIEDLVCYNPIIISGLAYGIDIHVHKQSLKRNIPTLGVMGSGIDIIYPSIHKEIANKMLEKGGLITENPLGQTPEGYLFPIRNRIIAGLSDVLIVVESAEKGGSLITAEIANSYSKDVFAVPGSVGLPYSAGCNKLIKTNKAHLLTTIKDVEYIMGWSHEKTTEKATKKQLSLTLFNTDEQHVIKLLKEKKGAMKIDELSYQSALSPSHLAATLLNLEFKSIIRSIPGKKYKLIDI